MMTPPEFTLYLTCLFIRTVGKLSHQTSLRQDSGLVPANVGDNITLQCFYEGDVLVISWYKQTIGQKPQVVSTFSKRGRNGSFHDEFKNDPRFKLETEINGNHLKIANLRHSDSATYFCAGRFFYMLEFGDGVTLSVKSSGLNIQAVVHQSESQTIQPGDSVTLNCTVHTGTCDGEHSLYWFRSSGHSQPRAIYTHGVTDDQCERKPTTHTQTCFYNLPMKSLNLSDAGTYYCAVLSCGEILFGNGTKIDTEYEVASPPVLVYFLSTALAFTITLVVLLASSVHKMHKINCSHSDSQARRLAASAQHSEDTDNLHYAALNKNKINRSRRQRDNTNTVCVYSSVKH
uniref:Ig-like domain-containing protein n=1 Tax=Myripristis murdjan TaxID=586833 RepID=A0A667ZJ37_9TELE